jgi:diacylglycerol kinase
MKKFRISDRIKSLKYAGIGILVILKSQHNAWIHVLATAIVCILGITFGLTKAEWCWIILAIVAVWTAEAFNTALEFLADAAAPQFNPLIGKAKDVAAGAVFITAIGAVILGILIIGPYVVESVIKLLGI